MGAYHNRISASMAMSIASDMTLFRLMFSDLTSSSAAGVAVSDSRTPSMPLTAVPLACPRVAVVLHWCLRSRRGRRCGNYKPHKRVE